MEPFEYDDYSEFDTEELDFEPPPRRTAFRPSREMSPFEPEIDDGEIARLRSRVRQVTTDFLDSCDTTRSKAKKKDEAALKQIDMAMELPPAVPKPVTGSRRRRSLGMPPRNVLEEIEALESFGRDTRPLAEKVKRSPTPTSRFLRKTSTGSADRRSPQAFTSRYHAGSLPPPSSRKPDKKTIPEVEPEEKRSTRRKMREIESRLDGILDYEAKSASGFKEMRSALQDIHDKMAKHRLLIDRYSGLDMKEGNGVVKDRVEAKVEELVPRMPCLTSVQRPHRPDGDAILNDFDPRLVPGYSTGLCITKDDRNRELRGRIRSLLCRTRETSKKDANNPHLKSVPARRREVTVE